MIRTTKAIGLSLMAVAGLAFFATVSCLAANPSSVADLRDWRTNGLPAVAVWSNVGFSPDWHIEQVRAGRRVIPNFVFKALPEDYPAKLKQDNIRFLRDSSVPINLRSDNWATMMTNKAYRVLPSLANLPRSSNVISLKNGVYGDENIADMFAPPELWQERGRMWGQCKTAKQLQTLAPNAAFILISNNNEACKDSPWRYGVSTSITEFGSAIYDWKPNLETLSVRVAEFAKTHTFSEFVRESYKLTDIQYKALLAGFRESFGPAWKDKVVLSDCYGGGFRNTIGPEFYNPDMGHHDGGGGILYARYGGNPVYWDFTSPKFCEVFLANAAFQNAESLNPNAFREAFLSIKQDEIFLGANSKKHAPITPTRWEAVAEWLLWSMQGGNRGKLIRPWYDNGYTPTSPFITTDANKALAIQHGEPELLTATYGDYVNAAIRAVDRICEHPVLRRFYQEGKPVCTSKAHPINEIVQKPDYSKVVPPIPRVFPDTLRTYPRPGDPDDGFRQLEIDINTPREIRDKNVAFRNGEVPNAAGSWVNGWVKPPWANSAGQYWPYASIKVWGTATELNGDYLVHLWSPCKLDGRCQITIPNAGTYTVDVPQPNDYVVIRENKVMTLDDYAAVMVKMPF